MNNLTPFFYKHTSSPTVQFIFYSICFIVYGIYLNYNYKEISYFNDSAVYLFYIDYEKFFFTPHHRYIAIFTQYLPLLACLAGFSFTTYVKSYVFNGLFSTYILYLVYGFSTRNWRDGWVFVLCLLLGYQYSYFYLVPEHFGYSLAIFFVLCYFHILSQSKGKRWLAFSIIVGILIAGCHLFAFGILLFGFLYIFLRLSEASSRKTLMLHLVIFLLVFVSLKILIPVSSYETQRLKILTENWQYIETLDNSAFRFVFSRDQKTALDFNALAIFIFCAVIVTKRFILGIMTLGIYFFTYYLNCLYSYTWQGTEYMEMYGRLIFFGMLVSLFILSVKTRINQVFFWGLCILCFMAFFDKTHHVKHEFTDRYQEINRRTQDSKFDKICIQNDSLWIKKIWFSWAMPHESLLVSTLEGHSKTIYIANGSKLQLVDIKKNHLNGSLRNFSRTELARTYFRNLDTSEYQLLLK